MRLKTLVVALALISGGGQAAPKDGCTSTWKHDSLKSYKQVERELHAKLGAIKILRISLCGQNAQPYFQVVVLNASGSVRVIQVPAK